MKTRGKNRNQKEVVYGALVPVATFTATVGVSQTNAAVQARFPLALDTKVLRVMVVGGAGINVTSFNIVQGAAAEAGVGPDDTSDFGGNAAGGGVWTKAANGAQVFTADQAITNTADLVQQFNPTNPETVYPQGSELTLRLVSGAAGAGALTVVCYGKHVDTQPTKPMAAATPHAFNSATDL